MARPKKNPELKVVGGIGHNSSNALNDDQLQALTRQHAQKRASLIEVEKRAKADRMNFDKVIKAELGANGLADIKLLEKLSTPEGEAELKAELERQARVARWSGLQIGVQGSLFDEDRRTAEEKAAEDGKRAGLSGENCQPPSGLSVEANGKWIEAWHVAQAVLAGGFNKKPAEAEVLRPVSEDADEGEDAFDQAANGDIEDYQPGDEVQVEHEEDDGDFEPPAFLRGEPAEEDA